MLVYTQKHYGNGKIELIYYQRFYNLGLRFVFWKKWNKFGLKNSRELFIYKRNL